MAHGEKRSFQNVFYLDILINCRLNLHGTMAHVEKEVFKMFSLQKFPSIAALIHDHFITDLF